MNHRPRLNMSAKILWESQKPEVTHLALGRFPFFLRTKEPCEENKNKSAKLLLWALWGEWKRNGPGRKGQITGGLAAVDL